MGSERTPLFKVGDPKSNPIQCRACGRRFEKWNGLANHGLWHVAEGKAKAHLVDDFGTGGCGGRYAFTLVGRPHANA